MVKKIITYLMVAILLTSILFCVSGCSSDTNTATNSTNTANKTSSNNVTNTNVVEEEESMTDAEQFKSDLLNLTEEEVTANAEAQMALPNEGDTIAIFHIANYGDITVKFFEDVAPKACENFITHAKEGYYDGITFHRVIEEFMIQGGDPLGNGTGGSSIWGDGFEEELSATVLPYRGALCMASAGTGTSSLGSQFFIVQASYNSNMSTYLKSAGYSNLLNNYEAYGGDLYDLAVYYQYTTFGQVIDGMDVVDAIASVETDSSDKPTEDVIIESIEITTYSAN